MREAPSTILEENFVQIARKYIFFKAGSQTIFNHFTSDCEKPMTTPLTGRLIYKDLGQERRPSGYASVDGLRPLLWSL